MNMVLRLVTLMDLPHLAALHAQSFEAGWDVATLGSLLSCSGCVGLAVWREDRACGFILARAAAGEGEILTLAVSPAARRCGIGRRLVAEACAALPDVSQMFLEVGVNNMPARTLYAGLGFTQAGQRRDYYRAPGQPPEDALILRAKLPLAMGKPGQVD